jgi:hypothetical protein
MNKKITKLFPILFLFLIIAIPVFVKAGIIPDCGITQPNGGVNKECGFDDFLQLINNVIDWIIRISIPVAAGVFAWAGFKYMTTGISDQKSAAKAMLVKVFVGFVFILAAWLIIGTIIKALLQNPNIVPITF